MDQDDPDRALGADWHPVGAQQARSRTRTVGAADRGAGGLSSRSPRQMEMQEARARRPCVG